jgi:DNA polymerase (family 10)
MSKGTIRYDRTTAYLVAATVYDALKPFLSRSAIVGSYRRGLPTVGDVDILVIPRDGVSEDYICGRFSAVCDGGSLESGGSGLAIGGVDGVPVNVFFTTPEEWGAALLYTTGSKKFNERFRGIAKSRGLRVNQYGVFHRGDSNDEPIPDSGFSERAVCRSIGVVWLPPEARTDRPSIPVTEIEVARGAGTTRPVIGPRASDGGRQ